MEQSLTQASDLKREQCVLIIYLYIYVYYIAAAKHINFICATNGEYENRL